MTVLTDDEMQKQLDAFAENPPVIELPAPHVPDVPRDSLGRSLVNPRGRPKGSAQRGGRKPAAAAAGTSTDALREELRKRLPDADPALLSDEKVGKAIAGAFAAIGIFGGNHWRLLKSEEAEYAAAFGPLARLYGPENLAQWISVLMILPLLTSTIIPRLAINSMVKKDEIKPENARVSLLQIKTMMYAENSLNLEADALEGAEEGKRYLRQKAKMAIDAAAELKSRQMQTEGIINGQPETQPVQQ